MDGIGEAFDLPRIDRYVAIGDSQTEGLHDYEGGSDVPIGWADRLAFALSDRNPDLLYANLAVRGKRAHEIRREQLEAALAFSPDLVSVMAGVNDVIRPRTDLLAVAKELDTMYAALSESGARVVGSTFPLPAVGMTRRIAPRVRSLNAWIRRTADRYGVLLVELEDVPVAGDPRLWNPDRLHLNSEGHRRLAEAFAARLSGRPDGPWKEPLPPAREPTRIGRVAREGAWVVQYLLPKLVRMVQGKSSGDGRDPKRASLSPVEKR